MATLERIRNKGVLLLVIIGLALLAFIVGDFLNNSSSVINESKENVAEIDGRVIKIQDYQDAIEQLTSVYKIEYGISTIDENTTQQIRQSVWDSYVKENLIASEAEKIGLTVSSNELNDMIIGNRPHQLVLGRKIFTDPNTGQFDRQRLIGFLNQLKNKPSDPAAVEEYNTARSYWMYFENLIKTGKLEEKYNTLISRAINANSIEAKLSFDAKKKVVDAAYVSKPYYSIADSTITVTDAEIENQYNADKEQYKQNLETRNIKYVAFNLVPSTEDYAKAEKWMLDLKPEFSTTTDIKSVVNANSRPYHDVALSKNQIDNDLSTFAFSGATNDVLGPQLFGNTYKMARIMETGITQPDSLKLKHIVVATQDKAKTSVLADSILNALKAGAEFAPLAMKYSQMQQSAANGGEIGWITVAGLEPKMAKACLSSATNAYFTYEDGDAIQIIQITEKTANVSKVKLAVIETEVNPSQDTYGKIYNDAKQFAASSTSSELFVKNAEKSGYMALPMFGIEKNTPKIANYKQSRQIIRWAFNEDTEADAVSDVFDCEKQFIVATVTEINPEGYVALKSVSEQIKAKLVKDKKAEQIIADINSKKATSLEELAMQLTSAIDTAKQVSFDSRSFGNAGNESAAVVTAGKTELNKISAPIKGQNAVYVVKPINITENPATFDENAEKKEISTRYMYSVYNAIEALKDNAEIEDNRSIFY